MSRVRSTISAPRTSFVGRAELTDDALKVLRTARLVTLVGPGGVGKSRLALEVARRAEGGYEALAIAGLADIDSPEAVERSLISALGIVDQSSHPPIDVLTAHLGTRHVLLVLDNCEHLWEAIGDVVTVLLAEVPRLTILATSRRYLEVDGEHVLQVPPLTIPAADADADSAASSDAMVLLRDRVDAAGRSVTTGDDQAAVVELARWSGGLPLVLELIAVRVGGGMSPRVILERLDGGRLLTARDRRVLPHHKTLRQVLDWSYGLCRGGEQRLWARLSVFSGGFDLAMAEEVCGDAEGAVATDDVVDLLESLVQQSIVIATGDGRYQQLQPVREYGLRRLEALGEVAHMRERHCAFVRRLAADAAERWFGPSEMDWLARVGLELPNIRAALAYCGTPDRAEIGVSIATSITRLRLPFLIAVLGEFCSVLETLVGLVPDRTTRGHIEAVGMLAWMRICQGDTSRARIHHEECADLARRLATDEPVPPLVMFVHGAYLLFSRGDPGSIDVLRRSRDGFHAAEAAGDAFMARLILALAAGFLGTEDQAERASADCLAEAEAHRAPWAMSWALWSRGLATRTRPEAAAALLRRCMTMQVDLRDRWGTMWCVEAMAWQWAALGHAEHAARLLGAATCMQRRSGINIAGLIPFGRERERAAARVRAAIGDDAYDTAFRAGQTLDTEQIYALTLDDDPAAHPQPARPVGAPPPDRLTDRQRQIARLVAKGLSNKDIADALVISQRTVENHLGQVFTRLGAHNRAQVAAWITEQDGGGR